MKASRWRKLSIKVLVIYVLIVVLFVYAQPRLEPYFFVAGGLILIGQIVRFWAAGHLTKNKNLTTSGPYAYVKNPLYIGTFFIMVGFCLMAKGEQPVNWVLLGVGILGFLVYYVPYKRKREGGHLHEKFGALWDEYDRAVPDYFPRLTPYEKRSDLHWSWAAVVENSEEWTFIAIVIAVTAFAFHDPLIRIIHGLFV